MFFFTKKEEVIFCDNVTVGFNNPATRYTQFEQPYAIQQCPGCFFIETFPKQTLHPPHDDDDDHVTTRKSPVMKSMIMKSTIIKLQ